MNEELRVRAIAAVARELWVNHCGGEGLRWDSESERNAMEDAEPIVDVVLASLREAGIDTEHIYEQAGQLSYGSLAGLTGRTVETLYTRSPLGEEA